MKIRPVFQHDCNACVFVGRSPIESTLDSDLYVHQYGNEDVSLISRYGSRGWDYGSLPMVGSAWRGFGEYREVYAAARAAGVMEPQPIEYERKHIQYDTIQYDTMIDRLVSRLIREEGFRVDDIEWFYSLGDDDRLACDLTKADACPSHL